MFQESMSKKQWWLRLIKLGLKSLLKPKENWEMQLDWRRELLQKDWNEEERVDHQKNEDFLEDDF